jgi:hypothetical protein
MKNADTWTNFVLVRCIGFIAQTKETTPTEYEKKVLGPIFF